MKELRDTGRRHANSKTKYTHIKELEQEGQLMTLYIYKVVSETWDGIRGKRTKTIERFKPNLEVGGLYTHLGKGFPGMYRVLSMKTKDLPD